MAISSGLRSVRGVERDSAGMGAAVWALASPVKGGQKESARAGETANVAARTAAPAIERIDVPNDAWESEAFTAARVVSNRLCCLLGRVTIVGAAH